MATGVERTFQTSAAALQMANVIFGDGIAVTEGSYSGPTNSNAVYSGRQLSPSVVPLRLSSGRAA